MHKLVIAAAIAAALSLTTTTPASAAPAMHPVASCKYEDSTSCYWDAAHRGNHRGTSFYADAHGRHVMPPRSAVVSLSKVRQLIRSDAHLRGYLFTVSTSGRVDAWLWH